MRHHPSDSPGLDKSLWALSWPLMVSIAMSISLAVTDSLFLSRHSDVAAAAVGALLPVLVLTAAAFSAIGQAGCAVAGQLLGAGQSARVSTSYGALLLVNGGFGIVVSVALVVMQRALPQWLGLSGTALSHAQVYLACVGGSQVLAALQQTAVNILNSRGATGWTLAQAAVANLLNIGLNFLFLEGPWGSFGVQGIAWATVLSRVAAVLVGLIAIGCVAKINVAIPPVAQMRAAMRPILRIGLPSAAEPVAFETSRIVLTMLIIGMGPASLAARVYVYNITIVAAIWSIGLGVGTQICIAYRIGAGRFADAHRQLHQSLLYAMAGSVGIITLINVFHAPIVRAFTSDPEIVELCRPLLLLSLLLEIGRTSNIVAGSALRSSGDARFVGGVGSALMWLVAVPLGYFFGITLGLGVVGVWWAMATDECVRGAVNLVRWNSGSWRRQVVFEAS